MKISFVMGVLLLSIATLWWLKGVQELPESKLDINVLPQVSVQPKEGSVQFLVSDSGKVLTKGLDVTITLATLAGPYVTSAQTTGEDFSLDIPYARAGLTPFTVRIGKEVIEGDFLINPGPPVTPLILAIGPRTTRVRSHDWTSVVIHPLDKYKNVSDWPLEIHATYPEGTQWSKQIEVSRLLAWGIIPASNNVGSLEVVVQSGNALAEKGEIDILPGNLSKLDFITLKDTTSGDVRDTWHFEVSDAVDALGNRVGDGQSVVFMGRGKDVNFFATRPLIQGRYQMVLPSYGKPGSYSMYLMGSGFRSDPVAFKTQSSPDTQVFVEWRSTDPLVLHLGPVINPSGAMVDDGTLVRIDVFKGKQRVVTFFNTIQNGDLNWTVPSIPEDSTHLEIEVAGFRKLLAFPKRVP